MEILAWIVILLMTVTIHEFSHGLVAYLLGDPTAKEQGRLTLNPLRHIDFFWTILFPALLFISTGGKFAIGMAKPVPVDFSRLNRPKTDMIWVGLAGPASNFLLAAFLSSLFHLSGNIFLLFAVYVNLGLGMFNLIPIPPLDGSRVLGGLLPRNWAYYYFRIEPYGFWLILALYFTGILFRFIAPGVALFCRWFHVPVLQF